MSSGFPVYVQHPHTGREFWIRDERDHARLIINCKHRNIGISNHGIPFCVDCLSVCAGFCREGCEG